MPFELVLHGTRGSLPSPLTPAELQQRIKSVATDFLRTGGQTENDLERFLNELPTHRFGGYGGNTPCVEVRAGKTKILIDAGSGLRRVAAEWMRGPLGEGKGEVHLFFTHFHWDHLVGLPFFTPLFIPGNTIHFYAVQPELDEILKNLFRKPYFPVPYTQLGATLRTHRLEARQNFTIGDLKLAPYELDHPDPCWGYRLEHGGKSVAYCVDTECKRNTSETLGADRPLYTDADLMVFDAQYTLKEAQEKVDWGHATAGLGLELALEENIKRVLFMHNDPASSDEKIYQAELEAARYFHKRLGESGVKVLEWGFAREGMVVEV